jgi:protein TonB
MRNKRYPRAAQDQKQQGTASLSFVVDRNGRVLGASIARSSGFPLLDEEVLALVQRAQPLPPAPPEVVGNQFPMTVSFSFTITAR